MRVKAETMIKAVIFDMDGVLIDSEPLWREAEIHVFKKVGIDLNNELCRQTTGFRTDETVAHWFSYKPWKGKSPEEVGEEIEETVCDIIDEKGMPAPGVHKIIGFFRNEGLPLALASSSSPEVIDSILSKLDLKDAFGIIHSAVHEEFGKPHPAVYITAARKLGVEPSHCLAVEDSLAGLIAAKSAKMRTIAIPEASNSNNPRFHIADLRLDSLADFSAAHWKELNSLNGLNY